MERPGHFPPQVVPVTDCPAGWQVWHVAETGSTNSDLLAAGAAGAPHRTVLSTDHQTAGRGRLDRRWDAPPGANLLVSLLFTQGDPIELMRRTAIAAVDAVGAVVGLEAGLKWPNDVLVGDAKLAGLLAQQADGVVVVGLGLNVGWAPDGAARLADADPSVRPHDVLRSLLEEFDAFPAAPSTEVHARYAGLLTTLGRQVRIELPRGELTGRVTGVEPTGELLVLDACAVTHRVGVGDVVHLRPV